jgi:branched-chain amino acid aminotransferase
VAGEPYCHAGDGPVPLAAAPTVAGAPAGAGGTVLLRAYGGEPLAWPAVADRLGAVCDRLGLAPAPDLRERVGATLSAGPGDALVRVTVDRGPVAGAAPDLPAAGEDGREGRTLVVAEPAPRGGVDGDDRREPVALQTTMVRRRPALLDTHADLPAVLARRELAGTDAALTRVPAGAVCGTATAAVLLVDDDGVHVPVPEGWADHAPGATLREVVLELARGADLPVTVGECGPEAVREAEEAALVGPRTPLWPVGSVDGLDVGAGPVVDLLVGLFDRRVERDCY